MTAPDADLDSDVDDKQMTHSDEPTVYDPTTKAERDDMLKRRGKHTDRLLYGPKTMMGRLIEHVERLEAEVERLHHPLTSKPLMKGTPEEHNEGKHKAYQFASCTLCNPLLRMP